jgi:large subunit ribosomal protein L9
MEIILLQKVENLGNLGDRVTVKPGYGRNYLIPKGKATEATAEHMARFEARRAELEKAAAETTADARSRAERLTGLAVTIPAKAGNEGRLFGSVNVADIATAVTNAGVPVKKQEVLLSEGSLRQVGEYEVRLRLHTDIEAQIRVNVVAEE